MSLNIRQNLKNLGLSNNEVKMCSSLITNGSQSVSELANTTKIKRTTLYYILSPLLTRGVVSKKIIGKRFFYSISGLGSIADNLISNGLQLKELSESINEDKEKVECELVIGKNKISKIMNEILKLKKGEVVYSIESIQSIRSMGNYLVGTEKHWQRECTKKGIVLKGVGMESSLKDIMKWPKDVLKYMIDRSASPRLIEDKELSNFGISLISYLNMTIVFLAKEQTAIIIKNKTISDSFKSLVDFLYLRGKYENLNKMIREKVLN